MAEKRSGIYILRHSTGAFYVGRSINLNERRMVHFYNIRNRRAKHTKFARFVESISARPEDFTFRPLLLCAPDDLKFYEDRALDVFINDPACLNMVRKGGKHSPETCAKISRANTGKLAGVRHPMFGKTHSPETRQRISEVQRGRKQSAATVERRIGGLRGKPRPPEVRARISAGNTGKAKSLTHRAAMSASRIGRACSTETRAKMASSQKVRWATRTDRSVSAEAREKMSTSAKARWARAAGGSNG
jgi:group I intron endonuclease